MRKTYTVNRENCPRCKFNDKVRGLHADWLRERIFNWYKSNTTYTEAQLNRSTHECERCQILFKVEAVQV